MNRPIVLALMLLFASPAQSSSDYEGNRSSVAVTYHDGTKAEVICDQAYFCSVSVENSTGKWTIRHDDIPGLIVLPSQLAVVSSPDKGRFVLEVEVTCAEYSTTPPPVICLAQFTVQDSKVTRTVVFKRSLIDERGAVAKSPTD